jgi:hypothetical protein
VQGRTRGPQSVGSIVVPGPNIYPVTRAITSSTAQEVELFHTADALLVFASQTRITWVELEVPPAAPEVTSTQTHTADASVAGTVTKSHTSDASIRTTLVQTHTTDAVLGQSGQVLVTWVEVSVPMGEVHGTKTHSTDAYLNLIITKTHTADAVLAATITVTKFHTADAVLQAVQYLRPTEDTAKGFWTDQDFRTVDLYQTINEAQPDTSDLIRTAVPPHDQFLTRLQTGDHPGTTSEHRVYYAYRKVGTDTKGFTVILRAGTVDVATWNHTDIGPGWVVGMHVLTSGEAQDFADNNGYNESYLLFEEGI